MKRPDFIPSLDSRLMETELDRIQIGDTITYADLLKPFGNGSVMTDHYRGALGSARKRLQRDSNKVFATIATVGLKRLNDGEIVQTGVKAITHIRRTAKRAAGVVSCVQDYDALSPEEKVKHNLHLSVFGAIAAISSGTKTKKLEAKIQESQRTLSLSQTLETFTK